MYSTIIKTPLNIVFVRTYAKKIRKVYSAKLWREERGLSAHPNAEGLLTDGPDYKFLDGRPTPLLHKQKLRLMKQQEYAQKIVTLCSEIDFAKERYQRIHQQKEDERERILNDRLKAKGKDLNLKKNPVS